ncbi:MAG: PKD domain-containing protein [Euryarchaeota archaeon]|nr:PKD domain-containing protein [Euryarchaeota archaeon]
MRRALVLSALLLLIFASPAEAAPPVARLATPEPVTVGETMIFDASGSSDPDGDIRSYFWNFGDGANTTSTSPKVAHAYEKAGLFTVLLAVFDSQGQSSSNVTSVTVARSPTKLSVPEVVGKAGTQVTIKATLEDARGRGISSRVIRFFLEGEELGASTTIEGTATGLLNRTALRAGVHNLTTLFNGDDAYLASANVTLLKLLPGDITVRVTGNESGRAGIALGYRANASSPATNITAYDWDFDGDGAVDTRSFVPEVLHVFPRASTYIVTVTAIDEQGHTGNGTLTVTIFPPHDASADENGLLSPGLKVPAPTPFISLAVAGLLSHLLVAAQRRRQGR